MARTSHESLMASLRATPEWLAMDNDDMALLKKLIAEKDAQNE